jgi:hypothetical protein
MSKPEFVYVIYIQSPVKKVWDALKDRTHPTSAVLSDGW